MSGVCVGRCAGVEAGRVVWRFGDAVQSDVWWHVLVKRVQVVEVVLG